MVDLIRRAASKAARTRAHTHNTFTHAHTWINETGSPVNLGVDILTGAQSSHAVKRIKGVKVSTPIVPRGYRHIQFKFEMNVGVLAYTDSEQVSGNCGWPITLLFTISIDNKHFRHN